MMIGIPSSDKSYNRGSIAEREGAMIFSSDIVKEKLKTELSRDDENIGLFDIMYEMIRTQPKNGMMCCWTRSIPIRSTACLFCRA